MRHSKIADRGSELMLLYPEKTITDANGNRVKVADEDNPVELWVNCSTDRQSSAELPGQVDVKVLRVITRKLPPRSGTYALVKFRGETWDFAIPTTISRFTKATRHVEISLRSRNMEN